jgi:V/A-type H+/Na+-transporting ATPase subunit F
MRLFLISDNTDTLMGMRLAGVKGVMVKTREEAIIALDEALNSKDTGILLITEKLAAKIRDRIKPLKERLPFPLIVEIPDRHGSVKDKNYILNYVKESIGIKI